MWDLVAELSSRREPSEDLRARPGGLTRRTSAVAVGSPEYVVPDGRRLGTRARHPGDGTERCVAARVPRALPVRMWLCSKLALAPARHCLAVLGQAGDPDTLPHTPPAHQVSTSHRDLCQPPTLPVPFPAQASARA